MRVLIFLLCVILEINNCFSIESTCTIIGLNRDEGSYYYNHYKVQKIINDTYSGIIESFQTKNILRMKIRDNKYLNATWENEVLTLFVTDAFRNYENESPYAANPEIKVTLDCTCTEDTKEEMNVKQSVIDINNHDPTTNEKRYDYTFGMKVPENLELTGLLPIKVEDIDVSNSQITFDLRETDYFRMEKKIVKSEKKQYTATLVAAKNLTAPLHEEFTVTITDNGDSLRSVTFPLTLSVMTSEGLEKRYQESKDVEEHQENSPVFSEHIYFADYNSHHEFKMVEPIVISYGAQSNTKLKQIGFEDYFTVDFENLFNYTTIIVKNSKPLPNHILKTTDVISIEIEATNEGLHMVGRTALLIRLPSLGKIGPSEVSEEDCDVIIKYGYFADTYTVPFILFLLAVFAIVFINVYVIIMFVNKNKIRGSF